MFWLLEKNIEIDYMQCKWSFLLLIIEKYQSYTGYEAGNIRSNIWILNL